MIRNPIRMVAVACVAVIAGYVMYMGYRLNEVLASAAWCKTALGAEKVSATDGTIKGLDACVDLLKIQLGSLSVNSHILFGSLALCLLVLIVIVIAGGRLELKATKDGVDISTSRDEAAAAAEKVESAVNVAAADKVDEIKAETKTV